MVVLNARSLNKIVSDTVRGRTTRNSAIVEGVTSPKKICHDDRSSDRDSNPGPSEHVFVCTLSMFK